MSESVAADDLRDFVRRIEAVEDEIRARNSDKSEIYKEVRTGGFDAKIVRKVVADRRLDSAERSERDTVYDLYWDALHSSGQRVVRAHVENIEEFNPETGEIQEPQSIDSAVQTVAGEPSAFTSPVGSDAVEISTPIQPETASQSTGASQERAQTATGVGAGGDNLGPSSRSMATAKTDVPADQGKASGDGQSQHNSGVRVAPVDTNLPHPPADFTTSLSADELNTRIARTLRLRPGCQKPWSCGSSGPVLCGSCVRAQTAKAA